MLRNADEERDRGDEPCRQAWDQGRPHLRPGGPRLLRRGSRPTQRASLRADPDVHAVVPDESDPDDRPDRARPACRASVAARATRRRSTVTDAAWTPTWRSSTPGSTGPPRPQRRRRAQLRDRDRSAGATRNGHGTHVAGTVAALDNGIGVVGVAPGVRLWSVRILDSDGNGLIRWYVCGLDWITAQRDPNDPTRPLFEAVNMSVTKSGADDHACGLVNNDLAPPGDLPARRRRRHGRGRGRQRLASTPRSACQPATTRSSPSRRWPTPTVSPAASAGALLVVGHLRQGRHVRRLQQLRRGRGPHRARQVHLVHPAGQPLRLRVRYVDGGATRRPAPSRCTRSSRPRATPAEVREALRAAWDPRVDTATDPDSTHEPLLDVSHIVAARRLLAGCDARDLVAPRSSRGRALDDAPGLARPRRGLLRRASTSTVYGGRAAHGDPRLGHAGRAGPGGHARCGSWSRPAPPAEPTRSPSRPTTGTAPAGVHVPRGRGRRPAEPLAPVLAAASVDPAWAPV